MTRVCLILIFISLVVTGCTQSMRVANKNKDYSIIVDEDRENRRFFVTLKSNTARKLCVGAYTWPFAGYLRGPSENTKVILGNEEYGYISDRRLDEYCIPGWCHREVEPGGELEGTMNFDAFESFPSTGKPQLKLDLEVYRC